MEISKLSTKKFLYFLKRKHFLYFRKRNLALFSLSSRNKKIQPKKIYYTSGSRNTEKTCHIFLKRTPLLYFGKRKPPKTSLYFRKRNFC